MKVRGMVTAASAAALVVAGPAGAEEIVEGTWTSGLRSWECGPGEFTWKCDYWFGTHDCVETKISATSDVGVRTGCYLRLYDATASIQHRVNSTGRRIGCLSTSGHGMVDYRSGYPAMSQDAMPVDFAVHDGLVVVVGSYTTSDGEEPSRRYDYEIVFEAGCRSDTASFGDLLTEGSVTVDVA